MTKLTGNIRYRSGWRGKLILQVEESGSQHITCGAYIDCRPVRFWRDAKVEDLLEIDCKNLEKIENELA